MTPPAPSLAPFIRRLTLAYTVFLALVLLMPFRFSLDPGLLAANARSIASLWFAESALSLSLVADVLQNVLLFAPLGFFRRAAGAAPRRIAAESFLLSLGAESLQLFSPGRCASVFDLAMNTAGACAGALAFARIGGLGERALRAALRRVPPALGACGAAASLGLALGALFLKVAPAGGQAWERPLPVFLGSAPGDIFSWRGVITRIAAWNRAISPGGGGDGAPGFDINFRGGPREGVIASLPDDVTWSDAGLALRESRVALAPAQAEAFVAAAGGGGPFSVCVWVLPERMDYAQHGAILSAGENTWHCACRIHQRGRDIAFFARTGISGLEWNKPSLLAVAPAPEDAEQEWRFICDGTGFAAGFNGRTRPERVVFRWWATPAGLLLASPAVLEPFTLYAAMFLMVAFFAAMSAPPGLPGAAAAVAIACIVPASGIAVLSAHCDVPVDRYAMMAVVLGAALGVPLGRAWACAARAE